MSPICCDGYRDTGVPEVDEAAPPSGREQRSLVEIVRLRLAGRLGEQKETLGAPLDGRTVDACESEGFDGLLRAVALRARLTRGTATTTAAPRRPPRPRDRGSRASSLRTRTASPSHTAP